MVLSDTTQHPALFARHPEWQPQFDIDGPLAVTTRKKLLDRAAADRMLVTGYHFPFPACGHIVKTATGYEHVPLVVEYRGLDALGISATAARNHAAACRDRVDSNPPASFTRTRFRCAVPGWAGQKGIR